MKKVNPLLYLPVALIWGLGIAGVVTKDSILITMAVVVFAGTFITLLTLKLRRSGAAKQEQKRIWTEGNPAKASIISIGTRGGGMNGNPLINFELDILVEGKDPYRVSMSQMISELAIPRIQPKCEIAIRIDPADPNHIVVDEALTPYGYK